MPSVEPRSPTAAGASTSSRRAPTPAGRAAGRYSTSSSSSQGGPGKRREARIFKPRLFLSALRGGGSSVGRAPGCGPGGRGFESPPPPLGFQGCLRSGSVRGEVPADEGVHELLLRVDELDAVRLELLARGSDGAQSLALEDEPADLLAEGLDGRKLDYGCVHVHG